MAGLAQGATIAAVLFTDLVGSTPLRERIGDDRAHELWSEHGTLLTRLVERHLGSVVKTLGDGVMAVFGTPSGALACAVACQREVATRNRRADEPLVIRIGVSAGEVTVEDGDVFGRPVVEAARLCTAAQGGQILVSDLAHSLAGSRVDIDAGPILELSLKGLGQVSALEIRWTDEEAPLLPLPPQLDRADACAFVGRADEQRMLHDAWERAGSSERCQVVLVRGEPGIGKTRLAREFARAVHSAGGVVLYGHFDEALGFAFQPFVEALRHYVLESPSPGLLPRLGPFAGELTRLVPELEGRVPGLPPRLHAEPEMETLRLYDAVVGWLGAAAAHEPLVVVVDDLQWASRQTFLVLRHILRASEPMRLLLLATYRDTDVDRTHPLRTFLADAPRWMPGLERVDLGGLGEDAVESLVAETLGGPLDARGRELTAALGQESAGNPFFLGELVRHLVDAGAFVQRGDRWTSTGDVATSSVPDSLRETLMGHLRRVTPASFDALSKAAVLGEHFDADVLQSVADLDDAHLGAALEEAAEHRLIEEPASVRQPYRFAHALVRSALYEELSVSRRVALHRRALQALEDLGSPRGDRLDLLAYHAWQSAGAGDTGRALDYTLQAADRAAEQLAHEEAVTWYRRSLDLFDASGTQNADRRFRLLVALGEAERRAGLVSSRRTLLEAAGLAKLRGDATGLAHAALANSRGFFSTTGEVDRERVATLEDALAAAGPEPSAVRARLLATLASELMWADDGDRRFALSDEAVAMARRLDDPRTLAQVLMLRSITITAPDTLPARIDDSRELAAVAEALDDPVLHFHAAHAALRVAVDAGDRAGMEDALARFLRLAEELRQPAITWLAALAHAADELFAGRLDAAEKHAVEALRLGDRAGEPEAAMFAGAVLLAVRRLQGRLDELLDVAVAATDQRGADYAHMVMFHLCEAGRRDEARTRYTSQLDAGFPVRRDMVTGASLTNLAHVCARLEDEEGAAALYQRLRGQRAAFFQTMYPQLATAHYLGMLAATMGAHGDAEAHFAEALRLHEGMGAELYAAETRLEWARSLVRRGGIDRMAQAREHAEAAKAVATERGAGALERAAAEVLSAVTASSGAGGPR